MVGSYIRCGQSDYALAECTQMSELVHFSYSAIDTIFMHKHDWTCTPLSLQSVHVCSLNLLRQASCHSQHTAAYSGPVSCISPYGCPSSSPSSDNDTGHVRINQYCLSLCECRGLISSERQLQSTDPFSLLSAQHLQAKS